MRAAAHLVFATCLQVVTAVVPVQPGRDEARRWAVRELAGPEYQQAQPSLVQRLVRALLDWLSGIHLPAGPGGGLGWALLVGLGVVVVLVILRYAGSARVGARLAARPDGMFGGVAWTSAQHRQAADSHAAAGRWALAVQERYRAIVRAMEERTLLEDRPGRTAWEAAVDAGSLLPSRAAALRAGAHAFDDVSYGGLPGTQEQDHALRALDAAVQAARPNLETAR